MHTHVNGFVPLETLPEEFAGIFHVAIKFEERESHESHIDPATGVRAWAEPVLALYVSVSFRGSREVPVTLNYARSRTHFSNPRSATEEDRIGILHTAMPSILATLQVMVKKSNPPRNTEKHQWI